MLLSSLLIFDSQIKDVTKQIQSNLIYQEHTISFQTF